MERLSELTSKQLHEHHVTDLMRYLAVLGLTRNHTRAHEAFLERWPRAINASVIRKSQAELYTKSVTLPGSTTDLTWAGSLVAPTLIEAFLPAVRAASVLSQLPVKKVPFNVAIPWRTTGAKFAWVQQGAPKPVTKLGFDNVRIPPSKAAGIVALTQELVQLAAPGSELIMQNELISGITEFVDGQLLDPANVGGPGQPAAITAGVTPIPPSGDLSADLSTLIGAFWAAHPRATKPYLVMSGDSASRVAKVRPNADVTTDGGHVEGIAVAITPEALSNIIALDAAALAVADTGIELDVSNEAAVQSDDAPGTPTAATVYVSFWQVDHVGIRVERFIGWAAQPGTVQYLAGA